MPICSWQDQIIFLKKELNTKVLKTPVVGGWLVLHFEMAGRERKEEEEEEAEENLNMKSFYCCVFVPV